VFVVGKNYRVQNIQLSKIRLAGLCRQSGNVGHRRSATCAALKRSVPTSVQETPEGVITSPKLFQRAASINYDAWLSSSAAADSNFFDQLK